METDKKISDNQGRNAPRGYVECLDYFDEDLNRINCKLKDHPNLNEDIKLPYNINEMIDISKILSKEFPFVRVDLYDANGKVYFSELTFIPTNGFMHLEPNSLTETWGEWLQLPSKQF